MPAPALLKALPAIGKKAGQIGQAAPLMIKGVVNTIQGKRALKRADASMPGLEDPEERAALNYTKRRRRAFDTGTASKAQRDAMLSAMRTGVQSSISAGGGTRGLNMMNQMFQKSILGGLTAGQDKAVQYNQQAMQQTKDVADRKLQLGMLNYVERQKRAAEKLKAGKEAKNLAMAKLFGGSPGSSNENPAATAVSRYGTGATEATSDAADAEAVGQ
jgi:hypothetical protein